MSKSPPPVPAQATGSIFLVLLSIGAIAFVLGAGMAVILFQVGGLNLVLVGVISAALTFGAVAFLRLSRGA